VADAAGISPATRCLQGSIAPHEYGRPFKNSFCCDSEIRNLNFFVTKYTDWCSKGAEAYSSKLFVFLSINQSMHTELKQVFINIVVMFGVVILPILVVIGAYRLFLTITGQSQRVPAPARLQTGEEQ
jgi:hypothetical protein